MPRLRFFGDFKVCLIPLKQATWRTPLVRRDPARARSLCLETASWRFRHFTLVVVVTDFSYDSKSEIDSFMYRYINHDLGNFVCVPVTTTTKVQCSKLVISRPANGCHVINTNPPPTLRPVLESSRRGGSGPVALGFCNSQNKKLFAIKPKQFFEKINYWPPLRP